MPEPKRSRAFFAGRSEGWERRLLHYARFCAESALSPDFLRELTRMVHGDFPYVVATISYRDDGSIAETHFADVAPSLQLEYRDHFQYINPFREAVETHHLQNQVAVFDRYVARRELLKSEFYNDFMRRAHADYLAALSVRTGAVARTSISIYRHERNGGSMEGDDARRLEQLWPFFRAAMMLRAFAGRDSALRGGSVIPFQPVINAQSSTTLAASNPDDTGRTVALRERFGLSMREIEVALAIRDGMTYKETANRLGITFNTVATHVKACRRKLDARSLAQMVKIIEQAARWGNGAVGFLGLLGLLSSAA